MHPGSFFFHVVKVPASTQIWLQGGKHEVQLLDEFLTILSQVWIFRTPYSCTFQNKKVFTHMAGCWEWVLRFFRKSQIFFAKMQKNCHFTLFAKINASIARMIRKSQILFSVFQICSTWTEKLRKWGCQSPKIDIFWVIHREQKIFLT